jgi:hypothetical protein
MTQAKNSKEQLVVTSGSPVVEIEQVEATDFPAPLAVEERLRMLEEYADMAHRNKRQETE